MIINNYSFQASTGLVTFSDFDAIRIEGVKLITNLNTGTIVYQFNDVTKNGTVSTNVLNLTFDTSAMSDSDKLMIIYEEPLTDSLEVLTNALKDQLDALKQIRKTLEPIATQDAFQRQRVVVESITMPTTTVTGTITLTGQTGVNTNQPTTGAPTIATTNVVPIWEGPVDQRFRVADAARTMCYLQRQNLAFS